MEDIDGVPAVTLGHEFGLEEDPLPARFLGQKESDFTWIENEDLCVLEGGQAPSSLGDAIGTPLNGERHEQCNGPSDDADAAISTADGLQEEPEALRQWKEQQRGRLEALDARSRQDEAEWKDKAIVELEEWHTRYNEEVQMAKVTRAAEKAAVSDLDENKPGTAWEEVARLCDFNPESSKHAKDVSRMRSVLISLKQSPLLR